MRTFIHYTDPVNKRWMALQDARAYLGEERWALMHQIAREMACGSLREYWQTLTVYLDFAGVRGYPARVYASQMCALRVARKL